VATLGTACTPEHVQKLFRFTDSVVFSFDGDAAGRRAAWRALENALPALADGKQAKFLFLPDGEDPDTFVRKHGHEGFERFVGEAKPLSAFLIEELASRGDAATHEGRAKLLADAKPLVRQLQAPMLSLMLRKALAEKVGVTQAELDEVFDIRPQRAGKAPPAAQQRRAIGRSYVLPVLQVVVASPALAAGIDRGILAQARNMPTFDPHELDALERVMDAVAANPAIGSFAEYFRDAENAELIIQAEANLLRQGEVERTDEVAAADFEGAWKKLMAELAGQQLLASTRKPVETEAARQEISELHQRVAENHRR
jgi:DNA primase